MEYACRVEMEKRLRILNDSVAFVLVVTASFVFNITSTCTLKYQLPMALLSPGGETQTFDSVVFALN